MDNGLKVKITGAGPSGILLAITLARLNSKILLYDLLSKETLLIKDKTYAITHSTRKILERFDLWEPLSSYIYAFNSLSISDTLIGDEVIFSLSDLDDDIKSFQDIGWVIKHTDLIKVFFDELSKYKNVSFVHLANQTSYPDNFDFEFVADGANSNYKRLNQVSFFKSSYNQACLTFKVFLRGNIEKRAYEVFRKEGPLALLPLGKNIYQIIWTSSNSKAKDRLNSSKSFLLDNLSTILPSDFKLDQIIGDINLFPISLSFNYPDFTFKKLIFVGDALHTFHPVGGQGLNACWRDVNEIYNLFSLRNYTKRNKFIYIKFKYYLLRFTDIFALVVVTDSLIKIFANNNIFLKPFRKIAFFLLSKNAFFRKLIINYMTKSLVFKTLN